MKTGIHSIGGWPKDKTARRVFRTAGYTLAGTALAGMTAMQSFALNPQAVADEAATADEPETSADASVTSALAYEDAATPKEKNESVYVFANADGTVKNTQVSSKITNPDGAKTLRDATDLSDIENVESDGEYAESAEGIVWDAQGENVYYKGTTTKQAPVSVRVSYELDGQEVSADELAGKSGKVKIRYEFTNHSEKVKKIDGKKVKLYTPFVCITGMILKDDDFKNVEIENGKVIDDGDRSIVVGYTMPGMADSLDVDSDDVDFPEFFEVTADAENFSIDTALTLVTSDLFQDIDTGKIDLGDLSELDKLGDAMDQLIDGSDQLVDGLQQISDGAHTLADGTGTLRSGTSQLHAGADSAKNGADQLHSGTNTLLGGLQQFKSGTKTTTGLEDALKALGKDSDTQADGTLIGGVNSIKAGVDQFVGPIKTIENVAKSNEDTFKGLLKKLKQEQRLLDKLNDALQGAADIDANDLKTLLKQLNSIKDNLSNAQAIIGALDNSVGTVSAALDPSAIAQISSDAAAAGAAASTAGSTASSAASQAAAAAAGASAAKDAAGEAQAAAAAAKAAKASANAATVSESMEGAALHMQSVESALSSIDTSEMDESQVAAIESALYAAEQAEYEASSSSGAVSAASEALSASASDLSDSASQLGAAAKALGSAAGTMADDATALKDSATALKDSATSTAALINDVQGLSAALKTIDGSTLAEMKGYLDTLSKYLTEDEVTKIGAAIEELQKQLANADPEQTATQLKALKTYINQFNALLKVSNTDKLVDNVEAQITQMATGMEQISNGLATINGGLKSMRDGGTTADGRTSSGLRGAVAALGDLSTQGTLINGAAQLNAGTGSLSSGLGTLGEGVAQLDSGARQLDEGANALATGTDSAVEGASALADGIKQLNEEGIQKLLDALDNDLLDSVDRFDAIVDLGKSYQTFSGKSKGTEGHVKFIYQTAAVSADDSSADAESE